MEITNVNDLFEQLTLYNMDLLANTFVEFCNVPKNINNNICKKTKQTHMKAGLII